MPTNKNALLRIKVLDELLSDKYHEYTYDDLTEEVCKRMAESDPNTNGVTRRQIENDLKDMEAEFHAPINRCRRDVYDKEHQKNVSKMFLHYDERGFSIFKKDFTRDEEILLSETLSLLGQFDGLPNFEGLEALRYSLDIKERKRIVSFTRNPLGYSNIFGRLFTAISQQQVIEIQHLPFGERKVAKSYVLHPYLLKEYNRRWFLVAGSDEDEKIRVFGLDRIKGVKSLSTRKYIPYDGDIEELFEDVIGVTVVTANESQRILFWVSDSSKYYVATKPVHESQIHYRGKYEEGLRRKYPYLQGGYFFSIDCRENYELIRELTAFGEDLIVLSPCNIREKIIEKIKIMGIEYGIFDGHEH